MLVFYTGKPKRNTEDRHISWIPKIKTNPSSSPRLALQRKTTPWGTSCPETQMTPCVQKRNQWPPVRPSHKSPALSEPLPSNLPASIGFAKSAQKVPRKNGHSFYVWPKAWPSQAHAVLSAAASASGTATRYREQPPLVDRIGDLGDPRCPNRKD